MLATAGLIAHADRPVKVLGDGDLEAKVFVAADAFTKSAVTKIEDAGGYIQRLAPEPKPEAAAEATEAEAPAEEAAVEAAAETDASAEEAPEETPEAEVQTDATDEPVAE